eukprot:gene2580-biopygen7806
MRRPDPRPTAGTPGWHTKEQFQSMLGPREGRKQWARAGRLLATVGAPMGASRASHGKEVKKHLNSAYRDLQDGQRPRSRRQDQQNEQQPRSRRRSKDHGSRIDSPPRQGRKEERPKRDHVSPSEKGRRPELRPLLEDGSVN